MANKDLFKQAIAEAKSVREAAIANAKEALEETLTPHLKDMLAAKLQEMEEKDMDEEAVNEMEDDMEEGSYAKKEKAMMEIEEEEEADIDSEESEEEAQEEEEDSMEIEDMEVGDLKDLIRDIIAQEMGQDHEEEVPGEEELPADDMVGAEDEEEIDLDELLREISEMERDSIEERELPDAAAAGEAELTKHLKAYAKKGGEVGKKASEFMASLGVAAGNAMRNEGDDMDKMEEDMEEMKKKYDEAVETVHELRSQLSEVNLLNAKLLYVNKVFKANNLTESQKVNVIAAFDKAETVKEAKLVFETVENNVAKTTTTSTIKESKLGRASKATGTTAKKPEVISEVSDAVKRMQKLAGIIK